MRRRRALLAVVTALLTLGPAGTASPQGDQTSHGAELYANGCSRCHGIGGAGTRLGPDLRGVGARAADFYLGTGYMPLAAPGDQPDRHRVAYARGDLRALTQYIASLRPGPPVPTPHPEQGDVKAGLELFTEHCAGCHQVVAQGGVVTGAKVPTLERSTATQIAEAVRVGPYLMPRFSPRQITAAQLNNIVRYVQFAQHPDNRGGWGIGNIGPVPEGMVAWLLAAVVLVGVCLVLGERAKKA